LTSLIINFVGLPSIFYLRTATRPLARFDRESESLNRKAKGPNSSDTTEGQEWNTAKDNDEASLLNPFA
jgi:hypothetical protein